MIAHASAAIAVSALTTGTLFALAHVAARGRVPYSSLGRNALILAGGTFVLAATLLARAPSIGTLAIAWMIACCAAAAASDLQTGYVFDLPNACALGVVLLLQIIAGNATVALLGVAVSGGALGALYVVTGSRGIGLGDVKLGAVIGAGFGAAGALHALQAAFIAGGVIAAHRLLSGTARRGDELKFAPYLSGGAALVCMLGAFS